MIYIDKKECRDDILLSLLLGTLEEGDLRFLRAYYEELEHYECCQGIAEAFVEYQEIKKDEVKNNSKTSREEAVNRLTGED
jgi:hypothetical protein